jgi:hypothetical protein
MGNPEASTSFDRTNMSWNAFNFLLAVPASRHDGSRMPAVWGIQKIRCLHDIIIKLRQIQSLLRSIMISTRMWQTRHHLRNNN